MRNNFIYLSAGGQKKTTEISEISHIIWLDFLSIWGQCFMVINGPKANKKIAGAIVVL